MQRRATGMLVQGRPMTCETSPDELQDGRGVPEWTCCLYA